MRSTLARVATLCVLVPFVMALGAGSGLGKPTEPPIPLFAILSTTGTNGFFGSAEARALKVIE
jgi:hypothetical protein